MIGSEKGLVLKLKKWREMIGSEKGLVLKLKNGVK